MKRYALILLLMTGVITSFAQGIILPDSIYSGKQGKMHVQGMAIDSANGHIYLSFTDKLVKLDLSGKLVGSVTGFVGHLGDLDISNGKIYGSLEYKSDAIGKGIKKTLGRSDKGEDAFYVAIFETSRIVRPDMNAEKEDLLKTVYIQEAVNDYKAKVQTEGKTQLHRFGCSGIDGITFAPAIGKNKSTRDNSKNAKQYLYVAYGIYGDTTRTDNDHQIILQYDITNWNSYAQNLNQESLHQSGPNKPDEKYFVKTGNSRYGIQNLAYDSHSGNLFAAVYHGAKSAFPNYDLFVIDGNARPVAAKLLSGEKVKTLSLIGPSESNAKTVTVTRGKDVPAGWHFKYGATGLGPLGKGEFYLSHDKKSSDGQQQTTLHKYKWTGDKENPFVKL